MKQTPSDCARFRTLKCVCVCVYDVLPRVGLQFLARWRPPCHSFSTSFAPYSCEATFNTIARRYFVFVSHIWWVTIGTMLLPHLMGWKTAKKRRRLDLFKLFAAKIYGKDTAVCLTNNWKYVEPWHFKHLRVRPI